MKQQRYEMEGGEPGETKEKAQQEEASQVAMAFGFAASE